jgi:hypothetical protein
MRKTGLALIASVALVFAVPTVPHGLRPPSQARLKALVGGTLIDGFGGRPVRNSVIIIDGERITAVGVQGSLAIPPGAEVISTEDMSVLPGLWDMHVHLMLNRHGDYAHWDKTYPAQVGPVIMPAGAKQLLLAGVTSARDLGAPLDASIDVRNKINKGELTGATMYMSGPFIQHAPYPGTELFRWGVTGVDDARAKVRKLADGFARRLVVVMSHHTKCFFENARPEPVFKYFSNARALSTFENSIVATTDHGRKRVV